MNWQPIETAPKDGTIIIGLYSSYGTPDISLIVWTAYEEGWEGDEGQEADWFDAFVADEDGMLNWPILGTVTHWLPIPTLPSGYDSDKLDIPSEITPDQASS